MAGVGWLGWGGWGGVTGVGWLGWSGWGGVGWGGWGGVAGVEWLGWGGWGGVAGVEATQQTIVVWEDRTTFPFLSDSFISNFQNNRPAILFSLRAAIVLRLKFLFVDCLSCV